MDVQTEEKSIHDVLVKFSDERFHVEDRNILIDAGDCFDKVVMVNTTDQVSHEVGSNLNIDTGEDKLEKVDNTGSKATPAEVLEDNIRTETSALKFCFVVKQ